MPRGRPSDYKPAFCEQAKKLCLLGATDEEIAEFFEVSTRTVYRWQNEYPEFCQALKAGKLHADDRVERSLYQKAIGYRYDAVKIFMPAGATEPVYAPYVEQVAPDTTAMIFWLKNRRAAEWRDKVEVNQTTTIQVGEFDLSELDSGEISTFRDLLARTMKPKPSADKSKLNGQTKH